MPRWTPLLAFGALAASASTSGTAPSDAPWKTALAFDYTAAAERFAALHKETPGDARVSVGYAASLLVKQPRTEANILAAHALLLEVAYASGTPEDQAAAAAYLLARIELDHLEPARTDDARARLVRLRADHPDQPLADQALVDLAFLRAFPASGPDIGALPEIETDIAGVKSPLAARDLHALAAGLLLRIRKDPAAALPHLVAARAVGYEQPLRNADVDLSIGNLARETGDDALARRHYAAFVDAAPRDVRASTVRRILAGMNASDAR